MKYILSLLLIFCASLSYAQYTGNVWCWGDSAGMVFNNNGSKTFFTSSVKCRGTCAAIADSLNNLLFYTSAPLLSMFQSGTGYPNMGVVYNNQHQIMENGDSLNGDGWYEEMVIVPFPNQSNQFILFHYCGSASMGMRYAIIDLNFNSGLGKVVQKSVQIMPPPMRFTDFLKAVKHGNGRDWWIICRRTNQLPNDSIYKFLVDPQGVHGPYVQTFGPSNPDGFNRLIFNSDGTKAYWSDRGGDLEQYDFNRCTGMFSNRTILRSYTGSNPEYFWSLALSPNDRYLYVSSSDTASILYQLDLQLSNPWINRDTIALINPPYYYPGAFMRLAPDSKIYVSCWYVDTSQIFAYPYKDTVYNQYNMYLSVINSPDSAGAACDFQPFSFYLGGNRTYIGLPNNPNYGLGPLIGSPCDTITSLPGPLTPEGGTATLQTTYVSEWQKLFVNAQNIKGRNCVLKIFDVNGREVFASAKQTHPPYFTQDVDVSNLSAGLYLVNLITEKETLSAKFVKEK